MDVTDVICYLQFQASLTKNSEYLINIILIATIAEYLNSVILIFHRSEHLYANMIYYLHHYQ
jgi:hypothetical protein